MSPISVEHPIHPDIETRLHELYQLPSGWDGYQGQSLTQANLDLARRLLRAIMAPEMPHPSFVPGADGSLQVEWHVDGIDIEADLINGRIVTLSRVEREIDMEDTVEEDEAIRMLTEWLEPLAHRTSSGVTHANQ